MNPLQRFRNFLPGFLFLHLLSAPVAGQITDPIPAGITPSGLGIALEEWVNIPNAGGNPPRLNILQEAPDGSARFFVNEQLGKLYVITPDGGLQLYLDVASVLTIYNPLLDREMGFYSFALHPDFANNGIFYTASSAPPNQQTDFNSPRPIINNLGVEVQVNHHDVIARWVADDPAANSFTGRHEVILRSEQPFKSHNMGQIAFNPAAKRGDSDYGLLYICASDGGSDGSPVRNTDPLDVGQNLMTPLGSILRIDPEGNNSTNGQYGIPQGNPFVGNSGALDEIYAYGLRNPHRISWDLAEPSRVLLFDIGQDYIEEINRLYAGANYGWGVREGTWLLDENDATVLYPLPANDSGFTYPIAMYAHPRGPGAIAGGQVYRGSRIPDLYGQIVFADFTWDGRFFHVGADGGTPRELQIYDQFGNLTNANWLIGKGEGQRTDVRIYQDNVGELYVTNKRNGWVYRVKAAPGREGSGNSNGSNAGGSDTTQGDQAGEDGGATDNGDQQGESSSDATGAQLKSIPEIFPKAYPENPDDQRWNVYWFGRFWAGTRPWIYHGDHGWIYGLQSLGDGITYWDTMLGWVWTSKESVPWYYAFDQGAWLYLLPDSKNPRWWWSEQGGWKSDY